MHIGYRTSFWRIYREVQYFLLYSGNTFRGCRHSELPTKLAVFCQRVTGSGGGGGGMGSLKSFKRKPSSNAKWRQQEVKKNWYLFKMAVMFIWQYWLKLDDPTMKYGRNGSDLQLHTQSFAFE